MKKVLASVLVVVAVLFGAMAQAGEGDLHDMQEHGDWYSFLLQFSEYTVSRMDTFTQDQQSGLIVDFYPNRKPHISVAVDVNTLTSTGVETFFDETVSGKIKVGKEKIHDVHFKYGQAPIGGRIYIDLDDIFCDAVLQEAHRYPDSGMIRIKVEGIEKLFEYSLNGFDSAMERCKVLLEFSE